MWHVCILAGQSQPYLQVAIESKKQLAAGSHSVFRLGLVSGPLNLCFIQCNEEPAQTLSLVRIVDEVMLFRDVAVQSVALAESAKKRDQEQERAAKSKSSSTSRPPAVPSKRMRQKGPDP